MQLDGGIHCQGFGSGINRLRGRAPPDSNVALSVSSPYASLALSLSVWLLLLPQQEKKKHGDGGGVMETAPLSHAYKKALTSSPW